MLKLLTRGFDQRSCERLCQLDLFVAMRTGDDGFDHCEFLSGVFSSEWLRLSSVSRFTSFRCDGGLTFRARGLRCPAAVMLKAITVCSRMHTAQRLYALAGANLNRW